MINATMKRLALRSTFVATLLLACVLGPTFAAEATTLFVNAATGDDQAGANNCQSNAPPATPPCKTVTHALTQAVATDTISVAAGTYNLALGETFPLVIAVNLTLTGAGAPTTILDATGANTRVILINPAQIATISDVTITGGNVSCNTVGCLATGGGIFINGALAALTLTNSTVSGNTVSCTPSSGNCFGRGGGLFNDGTMTLTNSTVSGNTASCTGTGCVAIGGGFELGFGTATLTNSTVSGNTASCTGTGCFPQGGGVLNAGGLTLTNVTISGNTASCISGSNGCVAIGGGVQNGSALTLTATIVANQLAGGDCFNQGTITSNGFNLDSDGSCGLSGTGDQSGVDPLLGPLALNTPGTTETHALLTGSPAIDVVTSGCPPPADDQRGTTRPQGTACDIGAYEYIEGPDLTGAWNPVSQSCRQGQCKLQGSVQVWNQGNVTAPASWLRVFLSDDAVLDPGDTVLQESSIRSLLPGRSRTNKVKVKLPPGMNASGKYVITDIDPLNAVTETIETNNTPMVGPIP